MWSAIAINDQQLKEINVYPQMTRMNTKICWRSSVLTALIIYPQMLDRCYTDFHLFQICLTSVDCIGPQADCFEERELWRIDRELKEIGPQADEVGEQQLSKIGQQLKEKKYISTDDTEGHGR